MKPTHRKALNPEQLKVLYALYKFRFGTEELLAKHQGSVSRRYMHERTRILREQGYIGRKYDGSYRLAGKPALYYLLPLGIEVLKRYPKDFNTKILRNIRRDANANDRFALHSINIFTIYCKFKDRYGDNFKFFTRSYLSLPEFDYFPKPLPDAYISITKNKDKNDTNPRLLMLECFDDTTPDYVKKQRIEDLVNHADSGDWTDKAPYPEILLVCETEQLQKKTHKWVNKALEEGWTNDLVITVIMKDEAV